MNYIKRALLSVWRHKIKTLILLVVFFAVSTLIFASICILKASTAADKQAKSSLGARVTIAWGVTANGKTNPLTPTVLNELSHLKHVQSYNYVDSLFGGVAVGFKMNVDENIRKQQTEQTRNTFISEGRSDFKNFTIPDIMLYGALDTSKLDQFLSGGYNLVSGRYIGTGDYGKPVAMISKPIADKNALGLGDKINIGWDKDPTQKTEFTIAGIFTVPPVDPNASDAALVNPEDDIFLSYPELGLFNLDSTEYNINDSVVRADYFLDDPANADEFIDEAKKIVNSADYKFSSNADLYREAVAPLGKIEYIVTLMSWASGLAGLLILVLIVAISLKGRNREFGILLAVGEKRAKIIGQVLIETLIPLIVAFCLALASGSFTAGQLSKTMLAGNVKSQSDVLLQVSATNPNIYDELVTNRENNMTGITTKPLYAMPINKISVTVSPVEYGLLAVICLLIVIVTVLIPCINILRFKPRRILTKL